jgi:acyl-CoA reductase-like NAD-dependent aldehyde dehydrogenase
MNRVRRSATAALAECVSDNRSRLYPLLRQCSTAHAAMYELDVTLRTLSEASDRLAAYLEHDDVCPSLAVILPGNMLLYSLALYAFIPAPLCRRVVVRAGSTTASIVGAICEVLKPAMPPNVELFEGSRRAFGRLEARSDALVFCGRYETGEKLRHGLGDGTLFIFMGSGINPFVVTASASLDKAADVAVRQRAFNGGRDCLCPDVYLVEASVADAFVRRLRDRVCELKLGPLSDDGADVCIEGGVNGRALERCRTFLDHHRECVVYGDGARDDAATKPTIVVHRHEWSERPPEFFAPVWNVAVAPSMEAIRDTLETPTFIRHAHAVTIFGNYSYPLPRAYGLVARDEDVFAVEDGNCAFGGWDADSSFVVHGGRVHRHPVLVPRELVSYLSPARADCEAV